MKRLYFTCFSFFTIVLVFIISPTQTLADSATLGFETQVLDLDTGKIKEQSPGLLESTEGGDIRIGYHADRAPHAVMMIAGEGVTSAVMSNTNYDSVTAATISGLSFSAEAIDQPLEATDTVVVNTDAGAIFKLGNAVEGEVGVTFSYELLQ